MVASGIIESFGYVPWISLGLLLTTYYVASSFLKDDSSFPTINQDVSEFRSQARRLIIQGFKTFSGPFQVTTEIGSIIMLSPDSIDLVNDEPNLNFIKFVEQNFLAKYDTFKPFRSTTPGLFEEMVIKGLTRKLPKFTKHLSDEMSSCLNDTWGSSNDWRQVDLRNDVLSWVARLSSRIFVGETLAKNEEWLRISKDYTVNTFAAVAAVKTYPHPLRWVAERTLPICIQVRADREAASRLLTPILAARKTEIAAARSEGRTPELPDDSIEWFRTASKGRDYDDIDFQLSLSIAAIHTTSDLLLQALLNICMHPEMMEPLRQEAVRVLSEHGWKKVALTELHLLDSFFKETQRLKPVSMASMSRLAMSDVTLPNGIKIRKGERTVISAHRMWSDTSYSSPSTFDGYRFFNRRAQPAYKHKSLLVSTSPDHLGFSHGKHACPGRFFAANEVKIAMVHLLLKYDLRIEDGKQAEWFEDGFSMVANPLAKISVRRRQEEINLDDLVVDA